jgi:Mg-chelatase subunit ChlD
MNGTGNHDDNVSGTIEKNRPESTFTHEQTLSSLPYIRNSNIEIISEHEAQRFIVEIVNRTRTHPDISRGVSVRGTIAFVELTQSFSTLTGGLTRESIYKAALVTLPFRITLKQKGSETYIIKEIAVEVLFGILPFDAVEPPDTKAPTGATAEKGRGKSFSVQKNRETHGTKKEQGKPLTLMAEAGKDRLISEGMETGEASNQDAQSGPHLLPPGALESFLDDLEKRLRCGEITPDDFRRQKEELKSRLESRPEPQFHMSGKELSETIIEMMDARDRQWNREINFDVMSAYYHVQANSEKTDISPQKLEYHSLKRLINDLEKQNILKAGKDAAETPGFLLTITALDTLLKYLFHKETLEKTGQGIKGFGLSPANERSAAVRRYTSGDIFRDISRRHTIREVVKQKKSMSQVRRSDFRVFLKQPRRPRLDIILCMDTSGSMRFHRKMAYARAVAAGLVRSALDEGDRIGIVVFNNYGQVRMPPTVKNQDTLLACILGLIPRGNTNIAEGIKSCRELLFQAGSRNRKCIVLISDGQPTAVSEKAFARLKEIKHRDPTQESALQEIRLAAAGGIQVSVVHIAPAGESGDDFIKSIAAVAKGKVYRISGENDLKTMFR